MLAPEWFGCLICCASWQAFEMFKKKIWHVENRVSILKMASDYQRKQNKHTNTHTSFGRSDASFRSMRYFLHFWHCFHSIGKIPEIICSQKHNDTTCTQCARMKFYGDCFDFILMFAVGIIAFWRRHSSDISAENVFALPVFIGFIGCVLISGQTQKQKKKNIYISLHATSSCTSSVHTSTACT